MENSIKKKKFFFFKSFPSHLKLEIQLIKVYKKKKTLKKIYMLLSHGN